MQNGMGETRVNEMLLTRDKLWDGMKRNEFDVWHNTTQESSVSENEGPLREAVTRPETT